MSLVGLTSGELLSAADDLLSVPRASTEGRWPRAVAILLRQALERSLEEFWDRKAPAAMSASQRAQLLCLRSFIDPALAGRAYATWTALSRACHYHPYELVPTASELDGWMTEVEAVSRAIQLRLEVSVGERRAEPP